jgi:hypothetical protein
VKRRQRILQAIGGTVSPEVLVQLRNIYTRMPRVSYFTEGNTRTSVRGEDVKIRRSRQAVARRKRYVEELGKPH